MIETLMALWNRGVSGRLMVMVVTFFCICISISLLFVTAGSVWGSLFAHGRGGGEETGVVNAALITVTAPGAVSTSSVVVTPTITPNPCLASPTGANELTPHVRGTEKSGGTSFPIYRTTATPTPIHRQKKPTPGVTSTPKPKPTPSPTFPAATPTATATPRVTPTLTLTGTPAITPTTLPTVVVTPTDTTTPGVTPTGTAMPGITPSPGILPTDTSTPNATPTALVTPTFTAPVSSPTAATSATAGSSDTRAFNGGSVMPGTPSSAQGGQPGEGSCYSDNLAASGVGAMLSMLQNFLWLILASSLVGTALFCAQVYRVVLRRGRG